MGYAKNDLDLFSKNQFNNEINTKDIGFKDKEGFLYITGRASHDIKISGYRINLNELEKNLYERFKKKFYCKKIKDKILVITKYKLDNTIIKKYLNKLTSLNELYFSVNTNFRIQRTNSGKINYNF